MSKLIDDMIEQDAQMDDQTAIACAKSIAGLKMARNALIEGQASFSKQNEAAGAAIGKVIKELDVNISFFEEIIEILNREKL